jgi:hypothetical protein
MRLRIDVLAALRIAAVIGLFEGPAVRNGVENVRDRRKRVRRDIFDVGGIGIEAMPKLSRGANGRLPLRGERGTKVGETREARAHLHGGDGDKRDFQAYNLVWLQGKIGKNKESVILGFDTELVMARREGKHSEDTFSRSRGAEDFTGLDVTQGENRRRNRKSYVGKAGVTDDAIERGRDLRLLAGDAQGRTGFARLFC